MSLAENKRLVHRLIYEDINRNDPGVANEIISHDFVDHTNPPELKHGIENHKKIVAYFNAAFSDLAFNIEQTVAEEDKVAIHTTMRGRHTGDFFGIPPTGRSVTVSGMHILRIADGKIAEHWGNNDDMGLMQQLGVIPVPGETVGSK